MEDRASERIKESLKRAAGALRDADIRFILGGGLAVWARGGPATEHDLDLMVKPEDAERALEVLAEAGMRPERPPEGWLYKAWDDDVLIDLIFRPVGDPVDESLFERAEELEVSAVPMLVMSLEDVMATKLKALNEHELDYERPLEFARSLREQIDWQDVRQRTDSSPYAKAFFTLLEELNIVERS
jgi:predicted nucleotidyltransferase